MIDIIIIVERGVFIFDTKVEKIDCKQNNI